jgi:hypothetical protein
MKVLKATRTFSVSPHIIYSLIKAQAGTLAKGVLECIMNSVDAGATSVSVEVTPSKLTVIDTGRGFTTREEIEACFEVFGFEHNEGDRVYGQFGIGRAQLWNFCSTVWRTNTFSMDVDIKNKGLDYDLRENLTQFDGLSIVGKFYERMKTADIMAFEREIADLAAYAQVPVTVNGKLISLDPSKEKWTHETDDAWIRLKDIGELVVYNLGVKVRNYSSWTVGSGGLVVTKPGVRLSLNMARNDILISECAVWKRIKPFLQKQSDERIRKKVTRLTEDEIQNLVSRLVAGEISLDDVRERKLITDIQDKNITIDSFMNAISEECPATVAPRGTQLAERGHMLKYAYVLSPITLKRFSAETPQEMGKAIKAIHDNWYKHKGFYGTWHHTNTVHKMFEDDYKVVMKTLTSQHKELAQKDWTPEEVALLKSLGHTEYILRQAMTSAGVNEGASLERRRFAIGLSETAMAWTDGSTRITLERNLAANASEGFGGMFAICAVLVHEYLHEEADTATHEHDMDFYDRYHRVMTDRGAKIGQFVSACYSRYIKELRAKDLKVSSRHVLDLDRLMDGTDLVTEEEVSPESALEA